MIELLACRLGRNDEIPNIELAEMLCESMDKNGVREIADGLKSNDQAIANDCIKVLYEIGERKAEFIADFTDDFITVLSCKNNRIIWGSMKALSYKKGSVITVDNSISVFAHLCKASHDYQTRILPILLDHLAKCRAKDIQQHAERNELSEAQSNRIMKIIDSI